MQFEIPETENDDSEHRGKYRLTPAMQAGIVVRRWKIEDLYDAVMAA